MTSRPTRTELTDWPTPGSASHWASTNERLAYQWRPFSIGMLTRYPYFLFVILIDVLKKTAFQNLDVRGRTKFQNVHSGISGYPYAGEKQLVLKRGNALCMCNRTALNFVSLKEENFRKTFFWNHKFVVSSVLCQLWWLYNTGPRCLSVHTFSNISFFYSTDCFVSSNGDTRNWFAQSLSLRFLHFRINDPES